MGYPERIPKESLKPHQKQSQRVSHSLNPGLVRAHRLSASLLASHGRPRRPAKSPPRARPSLDREPILRLARGPARKASDEMSILRLARSQLGNNPSLPPRPVSPTARRVPLMRQLLPRYQPNDGSTLRSGRRDRKSRQRHTDWDRMGQGLPATMLWFCAHDKHPHYSVPPNPCPVLSCPGRYGAYATSRLMGCSAVSCHRPSDVAGVVGLINWMRRSIGEINRGRGDGVIAELVSSEIENRHLI